jgi:glutamate synthase domain-containing protein 2
VHAEGYEWINHSVSPTTPHSHGFRITIGEQRAQPYSASVFNISAMSFGALSANAILSLNAGTKRGSFNADKFAATACEPQVERMHFIDKLRTLSGGKPTGFKLCIGHPWEWFAMVKAMLSTGITPDFIAVDGAEGGTGAAPVKFTDHVGSPLQEGLQAK